MYRMDKLQELVKAENQRCTNNVYKTIICAIQDITVEFKLETKKIQFFSVKFLLYIVRFAQRCHGVIDINLHRMFTTILSPVIDLIMVKYDKILLINFYYF